MSTRYTSFSCEKIRNGPFLIYSGDRAIRRGGELLQQVKKASGRPQKRGPRNQNYLTTAPPRPPSLARGYPVPNQLIVPSPPFSKVMTHNRGPATNPEIHTCLCSTR